MTERSRQLLLLLCLVSWGAQHGMAQDENQNQELELPERVAYIPVLPGPERSQRVEATAVSPYQDDPDAIAEGRRLFDWYNCSGCHAPQGVGGMGPPLSDAAWLYGSAGGSIFNSIWEGRPAGMPTWAGHIPTDAVWKLVAYIETLPGDNPAWAR